MKAKAHAMRRRFTAQFVCLSTVAFLTNATAQPVADQPGVTLDLPRTPAEFPGFVAHDGFDWIQLKSGEWLKGKLKAMQDRKLEFDSEELDDQDFDWEDIHQLITSRSVDVLFGDRTEASGPVRINQKEIVIEGSEPRTFPRGDVLGITPTGQREWDYWSGKVSLGATFRSGNSDQIEYNANFHLQRRTPSTRAVIDYIGYFSKTDGDETANSHRVNATFDYWLSRRLFLRVPGVEYYRDPFQNFAHRITAYLGLGYDIFDRKRLEWNVVLGPAYQYAIYDSVQPGEDEEQGTAALVLSSRAEIELTRRIDLTLEYRGQLTSREAGETTHHGVATLETELTRSLDLDVSLIWDRISMPKPDSSGNVPEPDDFRLVLSLGLDF
ncbi:DUF481 domain-containing protein [bacterium]|nr:DUF481 domain-containing protein [bacterium]